MPLSVATYAHLKEQRVIATVNLKKPNSKGELTIEVTGTLEGLHEKGIMVRPSGRVMAEMIYADDLEDLRPVPPDPVKRKTIKKILPGEARQHMADRHGWKIQILNDVQNDEAHVFELHSSIDHGMLSHDHD